MLIVLLALILVVSLFLLRSNEVVEEMTIPEETTIVYFYAPWCEECKKFNGEWSKLKRIFKDNDKIKMIEINCDDNLELCKKVRLDALPNIRFIRNGRTTKYPYLHNRTYEDILRYIRTMSL